MSSPEERHAALVRRACADYDSDLYLTESSVEEVIIRSLQGTTSAAEDFRLRRWRMASAENERRYSEIARVWAITEVGRSQSYGASRPSASDLIALSGSRHTRVSAAHSRPSRSWLQPALAAVAMLLLVVGIERVWRRASDAGEFSATELTTGPAEMVTVRLRDGSVVRVAPNSQLRVTPTAATREVWLDGKAYFVVARDERRPFVVRTRVGDALVLGTSFEVRLEKEHLRVAVVEGRVAVSASDSTVFVGVGQQSRAAPGVAPSLEPFDNASRELAWLRGLLVFQATPLAQVARELEQHYDVRVLLTDEEIAARTVTASFSGETVAEVLAVVCRVTNARCSIEGSTISIEPNPDE